MLVGTGCEEVGNAHIHIDDWGRRLCLDGNHLIVRERQPPAISTPVERHTGIDGLSIEYLSMVSSQFDLNVNLSSITHAL
jgi:hypothetical protein